jgi:hypothetical protein
MLCAKGYRVVFTMVDGAVYSPPASASLLHDERGVDWPARSGLVMPFARTGQKLLQPTPEVKRYFGDYEVSRGRVKLPPRALSDWRELGQVQRATYYRRGDSFYGSPTEDGDEHEFGERSFFGLIGGKPLPTLYRRARIYRIELGEGASWDFRGFVG